MSEPNYKLLIDFISNEAVRYVPEFAQFEKEVAKLLTPQIQIKEKIVYKTKIVHAPPLFMENEIREIKKSLNLLRECSEEWAENGDVEQTKSHETIVKAIQKMIRKRG